MSQPPQSPVPEAKPRKPSFWRTLRVIGWGFLGVRKNSEYQRDLAHINAVHVIVAGLIGAVLLVVLLLLIVNWVVVGETPTVQTGQWQTQAPATVKQAQVAIN